MNGTVQTTLETGPFFGLKTPLAKPRWAEGGDLSLSARRRGLTLIELLVVLGIMLTLVVIAAPALRPAIEGRRAREAARGLSVFLGSARSRAMETGRPAGVIFERFTNRNQACIVVRPAEVPPLYGGDTTNAGFTLQTLTVGAVCTVSATANSDVTMSLMSTNDTLQFNYQGPWYSITASSGSTLMLSTTGCIPPWPSGAPTTTALPFQACRQPQPAAGSGFQMPYGAVVDMVFSGMGDSGQFDIGNSEGYPSSPVTVIFSPTGSVLAVYYRNNVCIHYPADTIYFLVGRMDRVPTSRSSTTSPNPDGKMNVLDPANFWVAINPKTGLITTAETYYDSSLTLTSSATARTYAKQFLSTGGR